MSRHPNARLAPRGRETMAARIESGEPVGEVAAQMGASRQTASKRVARARRWGCEASRAGALDAFIEHYNWERPHSACGGGLSPMSRVVGFNNVMAHNS